ncbi:iron-containing alcohol dehydrogenase [Shewanella dokdonensis]|uniref:Iron-containing alcohol dehydrogenase n=1 Tax=Shewanella dokdonensis TaxID=712036 RepID=A0ABX8DL09_9GAMM|nr:iron-containing alcohol dehydrogenase [Shewanella dokdonensis]MCL1075670.1 iron-containing alcohol dehydrogenase [Shewanella dokdonensis]QVK24666.1 iron-containing alcohol dehydrogenase [Shewanella dokdonensis]
MFNFDYRNPTHIVFGKDRIAEIDKLVPQQARVLVLYGGGSVKKFGTLAAVKQALANRQVFEFGGIEANPRYETLMRAAAIAKAENIDFLLAVGGGSVMDGTKFIALATHFAGDAASLLWSGTAAVDSSKILPLATVATLPATGSEMNAFAVVSHPKGKFGITHPQCYPQFSVLDPSLTFTLPKIQVANGVVDAFVHVCEQYVTYTAEARVQDRFAEGLLRTLIEVGPVTVAQPQDYDARANLVWAATNALNGLIGTGVPQDWATHMIGHELTARFGIDHAQTLAIVMPSLWQVCREQKHDKLLQYAERVWDIKTGSDAERIDMAIAKTRAFFESLGIKTRLRDYDAAQADIDDIISALEAHHMVKLGEHQSITPAVSRQILEQAW